MGRKRNRSPHPGVVLIEAGYGHTRWRARFRDPDLGRVVKVTLEDHDARSGPTRRAWAIKKSAALAKRRSEIDLGGTRATGETGWNAAWERYKKAHRHLAPGTIDRYRLTGEAIETWAKTVGIGSPDRLTKGALMQLREYLLDMSLARRADGSGVTRNNYLKAASVLLRYYRRAQLTPFIDSDAISDACKTIGTDRPEIPIYRQPMIRELLTTALKADALPNAKFQIGPMLAVHLLSGARPAEVISVEWHEIDFDAVDDGGRVVGAIRLPPKKTKTKTGRTIGLEVSPLLRALLLALRARNDHGRVFPLKRDQLRYATEWFREQGAPEAFLWKTCRKTCGTFLANAPGIYGAAATLHTAKQLGHTVTVAERHYLNMVRGIPRDVTTLEAAMGCADLIEQVIARLSLPAATSPRTGRASAGR